jgi:hypothetical protein
VDVKKINVDGIFAIAAQTIEFSTQKESQDDIDILTNWQHSKKID